MHAIMIAVEGPCISAIRTAGIKAMSGPKFGIKFSKHAISASVGTSGIPIINKPIPVRIAIKKKPMISPSSHFFKTFLRSVINSFPFSFAFTGQRNDSCFVIKRFCIFFDNSLLSKVMPFKFFL